MSVKVGINGFGRIGRIALRVAMEKDTQCDIVAINDIFPVQSLAHLFRFDSVFGRFPGEVRWDSENLIVNGKKIRVFAEKSPEKIPWGQFGVEMVVESTGLFTSREAAAKHLTGSVRKVIISAPAKDADITMVLGVNEEQYDPDRHHIISNASCTTNCLAPVAKVLLENFGIQNGLMTTIHSYTNDQRLLDLPHKDLRRARAGALSMIPTTTGAAEAVGLVLPQLKGKLTGISVRVPTPNVSLVDFTAVLERPASIEEVKTAFKRAAEGDLRHILGYSEDPVVSVDFLKDSRSAIVDAPFILLVDQRTVKVLAWYDNEWGYSTRLVELCEYVGGRAGKTRTTAGPAVARPV
ncbi:MAG: type I glyceraldehyde-3-phosphate dehydrogenase [Acidobacteria bacterium]|nr:type I glyceraldehyde-3-phosphate dehydrogenase [Acidobacteriota bacterium]